MGTNFKSCVDLLPAPTPDMSKRAVFTNITKLPSHIARETAVEVLHDHDEMITLNPLVIRHTSSTPPPNATPEEVKVMSWYEITDEIIYIPGTQVKGETSYKVGFYDIPLGCQTHVFAPAGVDIKAKWSVGGSLPHEERESVELGLNAPREGLYIREDVDLRCSVFVMNFVKRNMKKSHADLCGKLISKAVRAEEKRIARLRESVVSSSADSILQGWDHLYTPATASTPATSHRPTPVDTTCACEGTAHEPGCHFYQHPEQHINTESRQHRPLTHSQPTVELLLTQSNGQSPVSALSATPAGPHPINRMSSVRSQRKPSNEARRPSPTRVQSAQPNLEHRQQQTYQLRLPDSMESTPMTAYPRNNPFSFSKPQSPSAATMMSFSGHTFRPQRPGEQAELPATTDWDADEIYSSVELKPNPLMIKTQHGHAIALELDADEELLRRYWEERSGMGRAGGTSAG